MLKGIILSGLISSAWAVIALLRLRRTHSKSPLNLMLVSFAPAVPIYFLAYTLTPSALGYLPPSLSRTPWFLGFSDGLLILILLFLTCVQFYYHFHNSITLRLLAEFKRSPRHLMTMAQIEATCSVPVLLDTRLYALEKAHLIRQRDQRFYPTVGGLIVAAVARPTREVMKLKA